MSNRQGVAYDADNLVTLTPGSLSFNGTTYDVAASGSAAQALLIANAAAAAAAAAQATANAALPKAGGTMTGDINMSGTQKVTNMALPTAPGDATNKQYVDNLVAGVLRFKGSTDCSTNPNYPAAALGDAYVVSVAGKIGGAAGITVEAGDVYFAIAANPGGTQAAVGSSWDVVQYNLTGALLSANNLSDVQSAATSRTNLGLGSAATYADTAFAKTANNLSDLASAATARTNLGLGTVAVLAADSDGTLAANSDLKVATQKATKTYADGKVAKTGDSMSGQLTITTVPTLADVCLQVNSNSSPYLGIRLRNNVVGGPATAANQAGMDFGFSDAYRVTFAVASNSGIGSPFDGSAYFYTIGMTNGLRFITANNTPIEFFPNATRALSIYGTTSRVGGCVSTNAAVTAVKGYFGPATNTGTTQIGFGDSNGESWQLGRDNLFTGDLTLQPVNSANTPYLTNVVKIKLSNGNVGFGVAAPTGALHLKAGTTAAGTGALKFTSGTNMTTPEAGAMEYNGTLSFTDSSAVRKDVALKTTYTPTLTPAAIGGAAYTEQTFTVTGLTTSDTVVVNGPAAAANTVLVHARVSAANTLALTWITSAAATPTSGTYRIVAIRS